MFDKIIGTRVLRIVFRHDILTYSRNDIGDIRKLNIIMLILKGKSLFKFKNSSIELIKDDIICFDTGMLLERIPLPEAPISYALVSFETILDDRSLVTFSDIGFPLKLSLKNSGNVKSLLEDIYKTENSEDPIKNLIMSHKTLKLLAVLYKLSNDFDPIQHLDLKLIHFRIRESLSYISDNCRRRITVKTLAKRAYMHPSYFSTLFKKEIGISPNRYILEVKIAKAKEFLTAHKRALVYTGEDLGFHDYAHFSRTFISITGKSPREFIDSKGLLYDPR